ncbi:MAG: hypothetical protein U0529_02035 [Thermoanaerobaculia bacterium]
MRKSIAALLVAAAVAWLPGRAAAADDFYQMRLEEGRIAYQTGSGVEAVNLLRIACFGLMDQPRLLSEGLVWLVLAQQKLDRLADADATLRRFLDVEKRFGTYSKASLPAETRKEFDRTLLRRIPPDALRAVPSLASLVEPGSALAAPPVAPPVAPPAVKVSPAPIPTPSPAPAATPEDRDARKNRLEAACMSRDWKTVVAEAKALSPFRDGEEPSMFYAAVGLFETGDVATARPLMEKAKPRIAATPFVTFYLDKVLR